MNSQKRKKKEIDSGISHFPPEWMLNNCTTPAPLESKQWKAEIFSISPVISMSFHSDSLPPL